MNNKVKLSQMALLLMIMLPGGKYISLPAILASQVGRDSWIVVSLLLLLDLVALCCVLWAMRNNVNRYNLVQVLDKAVGKVITRIILILLFLWLGMRMVTLATSMYKLFAVAFSIKANWLGFCLPLIAVMLFLISRGFKAIARLNQLLAGLILLAVFSIIVYPLIAVDKSNLVPMLSQDFGRVGMSILDNHFWFADYFFFYFLLSDVKIGKRVFGTVLLPFGVGALLCIAMNAVFIALYGELAQYTDLAMSKVSQYALALSTAGRLDWLSLSVWTLSVCIKLTVLAYSLYTCSVYLFGLRSVHLHWLPIVAIVAIMMLPLLVPAEDILDKGLMVFNIPFGIVQYILPLTLPLWVYIANKRHAKPQLLGQMERTA